MKRTKETTIFCRKLSFLFGAGDGTWTHTTLRSLAPEASASANSATPAYTYINFIFLHGWNLPRRTCYKLLRSKYAVVFCLKLSYMKNCYTVFHFREILQFHASAYQKLQSSFWLPRNLRFRAIPHIQICFANLNIHTSAYINFIFLHGWNLPRRTCYKLLRSKYADITLPAYLQR